MAVSFMPVMHDRVNEYYCAASQTIAKGDPVVVNASGLVEIADATSAALAGIAATAVTSSSAGDAILIYDDPRVILRGKCDNSAENLQATVGDEVDLIGSTGAFYVNLGASAVDVFVVRKIATKIDPLQDGSFTTFTDAALIEVEINLHQFSA